jgi:cytochrome c-type biogenesis protein CcmH
MTLRSFRRLSVVCLAVAALAFPAGTLAARASLADIEDEVMCPVCGTLLELSDSPQAERERSYINTLIARNRTKQQIEDALVRQYGPIVLATPSSHGFDLTAWIVPGIAVIVLAGGLGWAWWRRDRNRNRNRTGEDPAAPPPLDPEDARRLDRDLSSYEL